MRKASTRLPEQGTQTPSPAPDLIPAETKNQPRTYIRIGTANGGTSLAKRARRPKRPKAPIQMIFLEEPMLEFGYAQQLVYPRDGLFLFGRCGRVIVSCARCCRTFLA